MRILFLLAIIASSPAFALESRINSYTPPPMFDGVPITIEKITTEKIVTPPLPPKRPTKFKVPQSFVKELLIEETITDPLERKLTRPDRLEILDQIDPQ
ncbi:MAG: hypothetical protein ACRBCT_03775 [Alphaproteobacteria bacterium]